MKSYFTKFGFTLNIGITFLIFAAYLAPFVPPDKFWPISFFGLAYPYLICINIIFLIILVLQRSGKMVLPLLTLLVGYADFTNTFQLIPPSGDRKPGIKILSYNVHSFRYDLRTARSDSPRSLTYFKSEGAAIICLQEALLHWGEKLSPESIRDAVPGISCFHQASENTNSGLITFSRYPIISKGEIRFPETSNLVIYSDIKVSNRRIIRVYNCHLQSYSIDPDDYSIIDSLGEGSKSRQIDEARKISYKLRAGFRFRAIQARKLADHIRKSPYPVIVCGDFNDTPVSYAYRQVRGNLKDAFVTSGWGMSNTYNGELPSFRIDYILYDPKFSAGNYQRDRVGFSDHFPVHCRINVE